MPESSAVSIRSMVVTGGSSGIGAALCRAAAQRRWHVWIGYGQGGARAAALAQELRRAGARADTVALPLDDVDALRAGVAGIAERGPPPQAVALCASPAPDVASLLKLTADQFRRQLDCAVVGNHTLLVELWRRYLRPQGGGQVVAVLSAAQGPTATPHMASYVAAKGGLEALLRAAAAELGRAGLSVSVVRPGYVDTPMLGAFQPLFLERARSAAPGKRFLQASEVADALMHGLQHPPSPGAVAELALDLVGAE